MTELADLNPTQRLYHVFLKWEPTDTIQYIENEIGDINFEFEGTYGRTETLISLAITGGHKEVVGYLLDRGVDCSKPPTLLFFYLQSMVSRTANLPFEYISKLIDLGASFSAFSDNKFVHYQLINDVLPELLCAITPAQMLELVKMGLNIPELEASTATSLLTRIIEREISEIDILETALKAGAAAVPSKNQFIIDYKSSPVIEAIRSGHIGVVDALISNGYSLEDMMPSVLAGILLSWEDLPDSFVKTHFDSATAQDLNETRFTEYGESTPLLVLAAQEGKTDCVEYMLANGANINALDSAGNNALVKAMEARQQKAAALLVDHGIDLSWKNDEGKTVVDLANEFGGFKRLADKIRKAGGVSATATSEFVNDSDRIAAQLNLVVDSGEAWSDQFIALLKHQDPTSADHWVTLATHCAENNSSKPSKTWLKKAKSEIDALGEDKAIDTILELFAIAKNKRNRLANNSERASPDQIFSYDDHFITDKNARVLKGFAWLCSMFASDKVARALRLLAAVMYKKVYGHGMRNSKVANAAALSLSLMDGDTGVKELIVLRAATKYNPALVNIERIFGKVAEARGMTKDELAALSVPDYGLQSIGLMEQKLGDCSAQLKVVGIGKSELTFTKDGKVQKSVPAAIKSSHKEEIADLKLAKKDIDTATSAHTQRIERLYEKRYTLTASNFKEQYIDHPLIGFIARKLIWRFANDRETTNVIYLDGKFINHEQKQVSLNDDDTVQLWHPIWSSADEVADWRNYLIDSEITQPFKQAHREVYDVTDAERGTLTYSNRYASHILKQVQFHALATQRGWSQNRGGSWDGGYETSAYKTISDFNTQIVFETQGMESEGHTNTGIYECVGTSRVHMRGPDGTALESIDPLIFSEVMRDIDLFVGVCSIGNDPNWEDRENEYWDSGSFGTLSKLGETRKAVLESLLPKLNIAKQARIEGRYLFVEGSFTTYKIHLGSSNILMAPNDRYLCIVEGGKEQSIRLPFEGDRTLSLILSKAFLLANDKKIKDKTILSQIDRGEQ